METLNTQAPKREERILKRLNRFYKSVLLLSLAMAPSAALAQAPVIIGGSKNPAPVAINAVGNWNVLLTTMVAIPNGVFGCEVTCTSTVTNPHGPTDQDYLYAAFNNNAAGNPAPADACVRPFDFDQGAGAGKLDHLVVASTCFLPNLQGNQTFYCLGQKLAGEMNTTVLNTSMHVICVHTQG
jgi:hypothetical protein